MGLVNEKGEAIRSISEEGKEANIGVGDIKLGETQSSVKSIKASDTTRSKNLTGHHRTFNSKSDMEEQAAKYYATEVNKHKQEQEKDRTNGLDVNDMESIKAFKINYTPIGNAVLLKPLYEEEQEINKIILPPGLDINDKKYLVMVPGLLVSILQRGDIITLKGSPTGKIDGIERKFNNVSFTEVDYYAIAGIFKSAEEVQLRVDELDKKYKERNK